MSKSKKGGLMHRRKSALQRLEATYEKFKQNKQDKQSWTTNRVHNAKTFEQECNRLSAEIAILKERIR